MNARMTNVAVLVPAAVKALHALKTQYDERALAAILLAIANINVWNRLNVATRQPAGASA
jgi:alkylhydroperoxidase family enzyme